MKFTENDQAVALVYKLESEFKCFGSKWYIRIQNNRTDIPRWMVQVDNGYKYVGDLVSDAIEWVFQDGDITDYPQFKELLEYFATDMRSL